MKVNGKCLCGAVEFTVEVANTEVAACHCSMCRNWSGGPLITIDCGASFKVAEQAPVHRYQSSKWADRGFCTQCGTHLFYFLKPHNQYHLPAGLLQIEEQYQFTHQIFIDEKPEYYDFANKTKNMTGPELFELFNAQE